MNLFLFFQFFDRLNEGGAEFTYPLLIMLLICLYLLITAFAKGDPNEKKRKLVGHISLFALVWGFLGHLRRIQGRMGGQGQGDLRRGKRSDLVDR